MEQEAGEYLPWDERGIKRTIEEVKGDLSHTFSMELPNGEIQTTTALDEIISIVKFMAE